MEVTNRVVDLVKEGVYVALRVRLKLDDSGSLIVKRLGMSQALLVTSPAQLAKQGTPSQPLDLAHFDTVAMSAIDGRASDTLFGPGGAEFVWQHQPRYLADDMETLKRAVLQGIGATFLPEYMCSAELPDARLVPVMPGWSPPQSIVHAVFPSRRGLAPAVRCFLDYLGATPIS